MSTSQPEPIIAKGLAGVIAADTALSLVKGTEGKLYYRGYNIHDLAEHASFEEVAYLLWFGKLPTRSELDGLQAQMMACRELPPEVVAMLRNLPGDAVPMAVLRSATSLLAHYDPDAEDNSQDANRRKACRLTSQMAFVIATFERVRRGLEPVPPRGDLGHAANFLYMLTGETPGETSARALDQYLVLLADHGFNASTFAARVTASTLSDLHSAITSALGTLKGPLHGGANQAAMEMFMEIGEPENVEAWYKQARAEGRRIMGMGHRVYKTEDPRVNHLRRAAEELSARTGQSKWYEIASRLEQVARADPYFIERQIYVNVDYYSAPVLYMIGVPVDQFTPLFAMSRIVGWTAHVLEQWEDNRLMRPRAQYVGPVDLEYVPIDAR
jgi:citrate synthase